MTLPLTTPDNDPAWLLPDEHLPLPQMLSQPQTLVQHLQVQGWQAAQVDPEGDRHIAACAVLACLRVGPLIEVVDALADSLLDEEGADLGYKPGDDDDWLPDEDEDGWSLPALEQGQPIPRDLIDGQVLGAGFRSMACQYSTDFPLWSACLIEVATTLESQSAGEAAEWLIASFERSMTLDEDNPPSDYWHGQ